MADDRFDDTYDGADNDAVIGGGGYMDDDIDIDDDDDDEPLVSSSTPRLKSTPKLAQSPGSLKRRSLYAGTNSPLSKKPRVNDRRDSDKVLRAAGTGDTRDYYVAKFTPRMPDLSRDPHFRMYRDGEMTVDGRKGGLEAHQKQNAYYQSFSGQKRMERYKRQGIEVVPDRAKKGFKIEVAPLPIAQKLAEHYKQKSLKKMQRFKITAAKPAAIPGIRDEPEPELPDPPELIKQVDTFTGAFDGKIRHTRYAIMVMNSTTKTVDVIPIDDYAWFTLRADRNIAIGSEDKAAATRLKKQENRMARFTSKYNSFQIQRDHALGDDTRAHEAADDIVQIGIRRKSTAYTEEEVKGEDLDFDEEFADDDLAQVDKESVQKPVRVVQGDAEQKARDFRKMIKDEPSAEVAPRSADSDSDDEGGASQGSKPTSPSASPSRPPTGSRSPSRPIGSSPSQTGRHDTPVSRSPSTVSASPSRGSRGSTPRRAEVAHLLPPPGTCPTTDQVVAVLTELLKGRKVMPFNDFMGCFDVRTPQLKAQMHRVLKAVAVLSPDPRRPRKYFIALKPRG